MDGNGGGEIISLAELRDRTRVFTDRAAAGDVLAGMLEAFRARDAILLAVPAGGVPVAAQVARRLGLPLDVAVVSKITPSWNSEVGYGAVAFDGTVKLNEELLRAWLIPPEQVERDIASTRDKVRRRVERLRGERPWPTLTGRATILIDDGLASGFTMRLAVEVVRATGASEVVVAVPTAHAEAAGKLAHVADAVYCANVRAGYPFAVADAYRRWTDVSEDEAARILRAFARRDELDRT